MKRFCLILAMALAMTGLCGCDEEEETGGSKSPGSLNGTWSGTMVATELMGRPAEDSDIVPITMTFTEGPESMTANNTRFTVVFQANGFPGVFSGEMEDGTGDLSFSATSDYTYTFVGHVGELAPNSMSGTWTVNIPGGMSGTWQASR